MTDDRTMQFVEAMVGVAAVLTGAAVVASVVGAAIMFVEWLA